MMFCAVVPTAVLGAMSVGQIRDEAQREFVRGSLALVRVIGFGLDAVLQDARQTLEVAASRPEVVSGRWRPEGEGRGEVVRRLREVVDRTPLFEDVTVLGPDGRAVVAAVAGSPSSAFGGFSPELADNYGGYVSDVYRAGPRGTPHIFMVVEVRGEGLEKLGFLAAEIDLSRLYGDLKEALGEGVERELLIVDSEGRAIYPPGAWERGEGSLRRRDPAVDEVLSTLSEGHLSYEGVGGEEVIAVYKSMIGYNRTRGVRWGVVLSQPTRVAFAQADRAAWVTVGLALGFLVLALVVCVPLARWMTGALSELAAHARAIGQEGAGVDRAVPGALLGRGDEIGALARSMSAMQADLGRQRRELELRHEALRRAERLSSVGLLAAGVAHEINNPLTTILGYSASLGEEKAADHPDRAALELIASEAARVREIVRGLLELSRRRRGVEAVDLREVVGRALTLSRAGLSMGEVEVESSSLREVQIEGEAAALLQVVMNLIANAVDALEGVEGARLVVGCGASGEEGWASLWVADNGAGMTPEVKARIFEPFFTTKEAGRGTGLGMAILGTIVEDHGGRIEVESAPGRGSRFEVRLPLGGRGVVSAG